MKQLKHFKTDACNIRFKRNISLLLWRMTCGRVEFTGVEVAGGAEITTPVQKVVASPHCAGGARAVRGRVFVPVVASCARERSTLATTNWASRARDVCERAPLGLP
jgi:hypothetical protein